MKKEGKRRMVEAGVSIIQTPLGGREDCLLLVLPGLGQTGERYSSSSLGSSSPVSRLSACCPIVRLCQALVDWRLEAPHMLNRHVLSLAVACLQIFVQRGKNLAVENLEPSDAVNHALQLDPLDVLVFAVHSLHPEDVVAEVQALKPPLLSQQHYHDSSSPIEPLSKQLLHCELILSNWNAVDKLKCRPKPVKF